MAEPPLLPPPPAGGGDDGRDNRPPRPNKDCLLPLANVSRIMRKALPANAKISKNSTEAVQECVSEFVSLVTSEAIHRSQMESRTTITADDLISAMTTLGFVDYIDPLKTYLSKYREGR